MSPKTLVLLLTVILTLTFSGCVAKSDSAKTSETHDDDAADDADQTAPETPGSPWTGGAMPSDDEWIDGGVWQVNGITCERPISSETVLSWSHPGDAPTAESSVTFTLPANVTSVHQPAIVVETAAAGDLHLWVTTASGTTTSDFAFTGIRAPGTEISGWNSGTADWDDDHREPGDYTFHWATTGVVRDLSYTLTVDHC